MSKDGLSACGEYTLHITLTTFPQRQEAVFDKSIRDSFFNRYRQDMMSYCPASDEEYFYVGGDKTTPVLYNPLRYHIMGNYDIAYVSLIDNFKFAQKLFEPLLAGNGENSEQFLPHAFQSFTGIVPNKKPDLKQFFYEKLKSINPVQKYFIGICNLKLNNGFLVGNGKQFLEPVLDKINGVIAEISGSVPEGTTDYVLLQCFSWFEISILIFSNEPSQISEIVHALRKLSVGPILHDHPELLQNSLYQHLFKDKSESYFEHANLFADTHSYMGIHSDLVYGKRNDAFVQTFIDKNIHLKSTVQWQVKPGHFHMLFPLLRKAAQKDNMVLPQNGKFLLLGKSDYMLTDIPFEDANTNLFFMRLGSDNASGLYDHVRRMKTQVLFGKSTGSDDPVERDVIPLQKELEKLGTPLSAIRGIDEKLKAMKTARPVRSKILKIFSNYNNGIQDIILFPFFLDFKIFIDELQKMITEQYAKWRDTKEFTEDPDSMEVSLLESMLMKRITIFQEGYNIRMLNCYQFEDITDFDLDFNSSIQQLLTAYSTIVYEIGSLFYDRAEKYGPIVQVNLKDTVANYNSINYYIHHLTSPEFVFATITKEILNLSIYDNKNIAEVYNQYQRRLSSLKNEKPYLWEMIDQKLIDFYYLMVDVMRFVLSYNMDFRLFNYWFWSYNLQNASLFDKSGMMNEYHFQKELFRIHFIAKLFNVTADNKCPLPELFTFWDRHYARTEKMVDQYLAFLGEKEKEVEKKGMLTTFLLEVLEIVAKTVRTPRLDEGSEKSFQLFTNKLERYKTNLDKTEIIKGDVLGKFKDYHYMLEDALEAEPVLVIPLNSLPYFQRAMYRYLSDLASKNQFSISFLRRSWEDGNPLKLFLKERDPGSLFSIDQTGGLFFADVHSLNEYFKLSASMLYDLWNFAWQKKRNLLTIRFQKHRDENKKCCKNIVADGYTFHASI